MSDALSLDESGLGEAGAGPGVEVEDQGVGFAQLVVGAAQGTLELEVVAGGEEFEVVPTGFGRDGTATARHGGVVSITGAIPGEAVRVRALAHRRGVTHARIVEVLDPSPDRVVPPCAEVANGCGACPWQHLDLAAQRTAKVERVAGALGVASSAETKAGGVDELRSDA